MAERTKATVLKTVEAPCVSVGSNPTPSASRRECSIVGPRYPGGAQRSQEKANSPMSVVPSLS